MHIYSAELFIANLDIGIEAKHNAEVSVEIKCQDLINTIIQFKIKSAHDNIKNKNGCGKAFFFSCPIEKLVSVFSSDINVTVKSNEPAETIASTIIKWKDFKSRAKNLSGNKNFIEDDSTHNLMMNGKVIGSLNIQMCIIDFGEQIKMPIPYIGSQLTIPLVKRRATRTNTGAQLNLKTSDASEMSASSIDRPPWAYLFTEARRQHKDTMMVDQDKNFEVYADMTGKPVVSPLQALFTPEYIYEHLCGFKKCSGSLKFKQYGLGPLATSQYLGRIMPKQKTEEDKNKNGDKPKKKKKDEDDVSISDLILARRRKPKTCCGTLDCPHGESLELPENTTPLQEKTNKEDDYRPKKCKCLNCGNIAEPVVIINSCGTPNCPVIQKDVPCPYSQQTNEKNKNCPNQRRLSAGADTCLSSISEESTSWLSSCSYGRQHAGADKYSSSCPLYSTSTAQSTPQSTSQRNNRLNPNCIGQACPYSSKNKGDVCHGHICPTRPEDCPADICPSDICEEHICDGIDCPFQSDNGTGFCLRSCPLSTCTRSRKKQKKNQEIVGELNKFLDKANKLASEPVEARKNCEDKLCPFQSVNNCVDPACPVHSEEKEEYGTCGGKICPLEKKPEKSARLSIDSKKEKRLSLLLNENGRHLLLGKNEISREFLSSLSLAEDDDLYILLSRLLSERKRTQSLNNYYNSDIVMPLEKILASQTNVPAEYKEKKKRKGPCEKDSCKVQKYKTCEECGGITRSGATCDNTDVSFKTISYDSVSTPGGDQPPEKEEVEDKAKIPSKIPIIKKKSNTKQPKQEDKNKMNVKITKPKKRKTRFAYSGGEDYPGNRLGHKTCSITQKNVPAQMGWLWNIRNEGERKRKKKWKPGVIRKDIEERIIANRRAKGIPDPPELKMLVRKKAKAFYESDSEEEEVIPKPTLLIQKKDGNYLITMNPLKDPKKLVDREDPYMRCKPIQFVITKPKKPENTNAVVGRYDEIEGEFEGEEDYERLYNDNCLCDDADNLDNKSSSSESELDIEFTTPAGIIIPERFKKPPNVVNTENQFKEAHFHCNDCPVIIPTKYKKDRRNRKK